MPDGSKATSSSGRCWTLPGHARQEAFAARAAAHDLFDSRDVDAVLGWIYSRFPEWGATGDGMVAHYMRLRSDQYYFAWCKFCQRLNLFRG